jgi:hypothetical protein
MLPEITAFAEALTIISAINQLLSEPITLHVPLSDIELIITHTNKLNSSPEFQHFKLEYLQRASDRNAPPLFNRRLPPRLGPTTAFSFIVTLVPPTVPIVRQPCSKPLVPHCHLAITTPLLQAAPRLLSRKRTTGLVMITEMPVPNHQAFVGNLLASKQALSTLEPNVTVISSTNLDPRLSVSRTTWHKQRSTRTTTTSP